MSNTHALDTLNTSREQTIAEHYGAAFAQLQEKIKSDPLETRFVITAGCVSNKVTEEIARRLREGGVNVTCVHTVSGIMKLTRTRSITVDVELPSHLKKDPEEEQPEKLEKPEEDKQ